MFEGVISIDKLPSLDLHGEYTDFARIEVNDFVREHYNLKNKFVVVIHGKGKDLVRKAVYEELKKNKYVEDYKLYLFNSGITVVKLIKH